MLLAPSFAITPNDVANFAPSLTRGRWPMHQPELWDGVLLGAAAGMRHMVRETVGTPDCDWYERAAECFDYIALTSFDIPDELLHLVEDKYEAGDLNYRFVFVREVMRAVAPATVYEMTAEEWVTAVMRRVTFMVQQARIG